MAKSMRKEAIRNGGGGPSKPQQPSGGSHTAKVMREAGHYEEHGHGSETGGTAYVPADMKPC